MDATAFQLYCQIFYSSLLFSFQYIQITTLDGISQLVLPVLQEDSRPSSQFTINQGKNVWIFHMSIIGYNFQVNVSEPLLQ
jgi:hypothetical protein